MDETSKRPTGQASLSQDGQTCNKCHGVRWQFGITVQFPSTHSETRWPASTLTTSDSIVSHVTSRHFLIASLFWDDCSNLAENCNYERRIICSSVQWDEEAVSYFPTKWEKLETVCPYRKWAAASEPRMAQSSRKHGRMFHVISRSFIGFGVLRRQRHVRGGKEDKQSEQAGLKLTPWRQ